MWRASSEGQLHSPFRAATASAACQRSFGPTSSGAMKFGSRIRERFSAACNPTDGPRSDLDGGDRTWLLWVTGALSLPCDGGGDAAQGRAGRDRQAFGDGRGERVGLLERAEAADDAHGDEPLRVVAGVGVTAGAHQDQEVEPRLRQFSRASGIPCGAVKSTSRPEPQTSMRETLRIQERGLRPAGTRFGGMVVGGQCTGAGCGGGGLSAVLVGPPAVLRGSRC